MQESAGAAALVGVALPPGAGFVAVTEEIWERGDAVLPLPPAPSPAADALVARMKPSLLVDGRGRRRLTDGRPVARGTAAVVATSGTTGDPKGVVLSHRALEAAARATATRLGAGAGDRWLCCLPLHHVAGFQILVRSRIAGTAAVVHPVFDTGAVAAETDATLVSLVPMMLRRLLTAGADLGRWRAILVGGAAVPGDLIEGARAAGGRVVRTYGMTEMGGGIVYDGRPLDGVDVSIGGGGRIMLRGPMMMTEYRDDPKATGRSLREGWFATSDLGEVHDGELTVLGRIDDVIVSGGEKVAPRAVEAVLAAHPLIEDVRVVGRDDPEWGQAVVALIVPSPHGVPRLEDVRAFVKERAPAHHAPRAVVLVDRVPARERDLGAR